MSKLTRREFIRFCAGGLGGLTISQFLSACSPAASSTQVSSTTVSLPAASPRFPSETPSPTLNNPPAKTAIQAPTPGVTPKNLPDLAVARGGTPEDLVRRAMAAIGGMERFVFKGANVIIKPNVCVAYHTYEYAATTNPWVVAAVVKLCLEAGARKVQVMDAPFGGTQQECYTTSGIKAQVEAVGGEMASMPLFKYVSTPIPNGVDLKKINIFDDVLKTDLFINVPIAKHHGLSRLTLGMKNLMGVIQNRPGMHININQRLADLTSLVRPKLTIVDAVRILVANGPDGGGNLNNVKQMDTVIASTDIVAADSYAATLFGVQPNDLGFITAATAMGLGRSDLNNLKIEEISAS